MQQPTVLQPPTPRTGDPSPEPKKTGQTGFLSNLILHDADPNCNHVEVPASGGGVKCIHCPGWFCF